MNRQSEAVSRHDTVPDESPCDTFLPEREIIDQLYSPTIGRFSATNPLFLLRATEDDSLGPDTTTEQIELPDIDRKPNDKNKLEKKEDGNKEAIVNTESKNVRQRLWTTVLSTIIVGLSFLLFGCTLGFPSGALLDLIVLEKRAEFKLTNDQADLFGVSDI